MKVLVIQIKMIGDVLASSVICEALKKDNPKNHVEYMILESTFPVVKNNPYVDKVIFFDEKKHKGLMNLIKFGKVLRSENYDVIIDVYGKWKSIIPMYFSKPKLSIGQYKWYTSFFYKKTVISDSECNEASNAYRLLLASTALNKKIQNIYPKIHLTEDEQNFGKKLMSDSSINGKPAIMIGVLGSNSIKSYPKEYMAEVLNFIAKTIDANILFNYSPNQYNEALEIYDLCNEQTKNKIKINFYTKSLRDFLCVLSNCDALIGNEGGATNMAKALNIKTFTIFSPWIRQKSWNLMEDEINHVSVHLENYIPEIYKDIEIKKLKPKSIELYQKFKPNYLMDKLSLFLNNI